MSALFVYLIKVNIALIIFCLGYYLVLRPLTFYVLNRVYLVSAILFATLYPLIDFEAILNRHQEIAQPVQIIIVNWQAPVVNAVQQVQHDKWFWLALVFWAGVGILAVRFIMQLLSLYKLHRQSKPAQLHQYFIRVISGDINPFSFWRSIYINPDNHEPEELKAILAHEQVHVSEWHTIDILLGEISTIFYWFNPGVWLMKRAIRENIEFITDQKILQSGSDPKAYQYSLLNVSFNGGHNAIVNHFNTSTIKKRIIMMNAKRSSTLNLTRYAFLVPAVVVLVLIFSVSKAELAKQVTKGNAMLGEVMINVADKIEPVTINIMTAAKKSATLLPNAVQGLFTDSATIKPQKSENISFSLSATPFSDTSKKLIQGMVVTAPDRSIGLFGGTAHKVRINGVDKSTSDLTAQDIEALKKLPGIVFGTEGSLTFNSPKTFNIQLRDIDESMMKSQLSAIPADKVEKIVIQSGFSSLSDTTKKTPLIIINGKIAESNRLVNLHDIEAVNVIKHEDAIAKYGEQAKNGAIEVKTVARGTGNFGATSLVNIVTGKTFNYDGGGGRATGDVVGTETLKTRPGYVEMRDSNGDVYYHRPDKPITITSRPRIVSGSAYSTNSSAYNSSAKSYQSTGRIAITDGDVTATTQTAKLGAITVTGYGASPNIFAGKLLIVDGKEMSQRDFSKIPADKIDVVRRATVKELTKYGEKAKNGALIITTSK